MLPSSAGSTLLAAPLIVIGGVIVVVFSFTTAGLGENNDHSDVAVLLNLTRYVPNDFTFISLPVNEMTSAGCRIVFTPLVRVAIVTESFCHS